MKDGLTIFLSVLLIILMVAASIALGIFVPLATVWALNTLFGLGLAYTFTNWLAVVVLSWVLNGVHVLNKDKKK